MKNLYLFLFLLLSVHFTAISQSDTLGYPQQNEVSTKNKLDVKALVGFGTGMSAYFGDLQRFSDTSPIAGHWGIHFGLGARLTNYLDVQFNYGQSWISFHENTPERNLNFKSPITSTGLLFTYNFNNFFKQDPTVNPIFILGISNLEFNSKTDFDGDYRYETDLRDLNLDGLGKYSLNTLTIPVGIGADIELTYGFSLRISSVMNFTFSDNIDNVSDKGEGIRKGDSRKDRYLYTGLTLLYTIGKDKKSKNIYDGAYFGDSDDEDQDKIFDISDNCPHTPEGVQVDDFGCPLDRDSDGIPDFMDDEIDSPAGSIVNAKGVTLTDEDFNEMYLTYIDSLGLYTNTIKTVYTSNESGRKIVHTPRFSDEVFLVQIAASTDSLSIEQIGKILSIPDVKILNEPEASYYFIGEYDELELAIQEKIILEKDGIKGEIIGLEKGERTLVREIANEIEQDYLSGEIEMPVHTVVSDQVIYRVQIGAFAHPLSMNIFEGIGDIIVLSGKDGLTRYLTGSYDNIQKAASRKIDILLEGFEGAFIVAYQGGKRISLEEAGNVTSKVTPVAQDKVDQSKIRFKIQVGAYKDNIPTNVMDKFITVGNVKAFRQGGITRYLVGEYESYDAAKAKLNNLQAQGFIDAFVVGAFNGNIISAEEANNLLQK